MQNNVNPIFAMGRAFTCLSNKKKKMCTQNMERSESDDPIILLIYIINYSRNVFVKNCEIYNLISFMF